jgi:hypothetical protein
MLGHAGRVESSTRFILSREPDPDPDGLRITVETLPYGDPEWISAMTGWLRRHGIEPHWVAVPGWIEVRPTLRQVAWSGHRFVWGADPAVRGGTHLVQVALREDRVLQLESPPMGLPPLPSPWDRQPWPDLEWGPSLYRADAELRSHAARAASQPQNEVDDGRDERGSGEDEQDDGDAAG